MHSNVLNLRLRAATFSVVKRLRPAVLAAASALLATSGAANAITYTFVDLGTLGGTDSQGAGINNAGQVVGFAYRANNTYHATVWNGTSATDLGTLGRRSCSGLKPPPSFRAQ